MSPSHPPLTAQTQLRYRPAPGSMSDVATDVLVQGSAAEPATGAAKAIAFLMGPRGRQQINRACWIIACGFLALHFFVVMSHSVNVPFWDDWEVLKPGALDRDLNLSWLIAFHNSHRSILTHFTIWLLY